MFKFLFLFLMISNLHAKEIQFFDKKIDYWKKKTKRKPTVIISDIEIIDSEDEKKQDRKKNKKFSWNKYLNKENDEFFKEGNYLPPAPFMEVARRPTEENIKNYFSYIKMKNKLSRDLQIAIANYQKKYSKELSPESKQYLSSKSHELSPKIDYSNQEISISTYFLTTCSACKKMFRTLKILQSQGIYVETIQIDIENPRKSGVSVPVRDATEKEIKGLKSAGLVVPFSIIRTKDDSFTLTGYQSTQSIHREISKRSNKTPKN